MRVQRGGLGDVRLVVLRPGFAVPARLVVRLSDDVLGRLDRLVQDLALPLVRKVFDFFLLRLLALGLFSDALAARLLVQRLQLVKLVLQLVCSRNTITIKQ